jgi:hypothetical protein
VDSASSVGGRTSVWQNQHIEDLENDNVLTHVTDEAAAEQFVAAANAFRMQKMGMKQQQEAGQRLNFGF